MAVKVKITQNEDEPIATEIIAQAIVDISFAMKQINAGRLNEKALVHLLHKSSGVPQFHIKRVLNSLSNLEAEFLK